MLINGRPASDFVQTRAVYMALEHALATRLFAQKPILKKAAETILRDLQREGSIFGREMKMIAAMRKGATLDEMSRRLRASRRTIYRYLSELHKAGVSTTLKDGCYHVQASELTT